MAVIDEQTTKVYKATSEGKAGVEVSPTSAALVGDSRHFVVSNDQGTFIKGPISIVAEGTQIRTGGLFVNTPDMANMVPSTIISPIPRHIPMPPTHGFQGIQKDLAFFLSLLV